jgi:hypothetical protein
LRIFLGIISAIVLGAIGSGIWERILSPLVDNTFRFIIDSINLISTSYKDGIYLRSAKGFHEDYSFRLFAIFILIVTLYILIKIIILNPKSPFLEFYNVIIYSKFFVLLVFAFSLITMFSVNKNEYINSINTYAMQSINILRPYIGEENYIKILSDYHQIKTAKDFYKFNEKLLNESKSNGIELPKYDPL